MNLGPKLYCYYIFDNSTNKMADVNPFYIMGASLEEAKKEFWKRNLDPKKYRVEPSGMCPENWKKITAH